MKSLLLKNIGLLATPLGSHVHSGTEQGAVEKLENICVYIEDGIIRHVGNEETTADKIIDCSGKLVTPGLVDAHTHLIFGGFRENEVPLKVRGASYLEILKSGGGILQTVRQTKEASADELLEKSLHFTNKMLRLGVTSCEAKSGYGLDLETEIKMLKVIKKLDESSKMDVVASFMGAHALPSEFKGRSKEFLTMLLDEVHPIIQREGLANYVDIFCEDSVFDAQESKYYLEESKKQGFQLRIHADEIKPIGGSVLAGELGAVSAEHLIAIKEDGIRSMAEGKVIAMLLPATSFYLGANYAPARSFIEHNVPVAMASDFNPGSCPCFNLQFVMNLGYLRYKLYPEEILTAVTINPACAIGKEKSIGSIEVGKKADIVLWNAENLETLCYRLGDNLVQHVIKNGEVVV